MKLENEYYAAWVIISGVDLKTMLRVIDFLYIESIS